ncbi:MAG: right-handed parallel beta-helix repeat-containing protein [Verrucomicrobiota bacterium]
MNFLFPPSIACLLVWPLAAHGSVVTSANDEDNGLLGGGSGVSLREAVKYSTVGDTITFAPALSGQILRMALGSVPIQRSVTIDASALPDGITVSGDKTGNGRTSDDTRVFTISAAPVLMDSLTISGGRNLENGGAIVSYQGSNLTLNRCTVSGNSGLNGGAIASSGTLTLRNSCFSGNSATQGGGAIQLFSNTCVADNSTFAGNSANGSGGAFLVQSATLTLRHATVSANSAGISDGGIFGAGTFNPGTIYLQNSIVAGNTAPADPNIAGTFTGTNNLLSGTPRLAPLGNYGGPTHSMSPLPGSPALSGSPTSAADIAAFPTDQRGMPRRIDSYHIGAVHYQGSSELRRFWNLDFDGDGSPFGIEVGLGTDPLLSDATSPRNLTVLTRDPSGHPVIHFGYGSQYFDYAKWVLKRSSTLSPGSFQEIYRFSPISSVPQSGIIHRRDSSGDTVTDTTAPAEGAFYRIEGISP